MHFLTDDVSEERLKALWLEAHPTPPAECAADAVPVSKDRGQGEGAQDTLPDTNNLTEREDGRGEVGGEGEEGGTGGSREEGQALNGAGVNEGQEEEGKKGGEGGGESGDGVKEEEAGDKAEEEGEKEEEGEQNSGEGDEKVQENGQSEESQTADQMAGFGEEPFVQATAKLLRYELTGILELLTQAIDTGQ